MTESAVPETKRHLTSHAGAQTLGDGIKWFKGKHGFDDIDWSDADILKMIADWLTTTITDNRMGGTSLKNLHMFEELCEEDSFQNIVLTTKMWHKVDEETGSTREEELETIYWRNMLKRQANARRFLRTRELALQVIEPWIDAEHHRRSLCL
ncbi:hypothetical protein BDZ97DRAFT_1767655 [Flammula alnicola]|nr:hypothetical protein BDZ97DRAFT_1767655 [Flammula alnicola]